MLTENNDGRPPTSGGVGDCDKIDHPRSKVEGDVVGPLDHGDCVVLIFLISGNSSGEHDERVLVCVQPLDLCYGQTIAIARVWSRGREEGGGIMEKEGKERRVRESE